MGTKVSIVLGILLIGSGLYINHLLDEIAQLKANAIVLQNELSEQNKDIENLIAQAQEAQVKMQNLQTVNAESQREINKLRNTFAKHDLDELAIAKPGLIESRINKATKRVKEDLINITTPKDEEDNTD